MCSRFMSPTTHFTRKHSQCFAHSDVVCIIATDTNVTTVIKFHFQIAWNIFYWMCKMWDQIQTNSINGQMPNVVDTTFFRSQAILYILHMPMYFMTWNKNKNNMDLRLSRRQSPSSSLSFFFVERALQRYQAARIKTYYFCVVL